MASSTDSTQDTTTPPDETLRADYEQTNEQRGTSGGGLYTEKPGHTRTMFRIPVGRDRKAVDDPKKVGRVPGFIKVTRDRKGSVRSLGFITVWHDRALAIIYGTALGGWFYIIVSPFFPILASLLIAAAVACVFIWQFHQIEGT
jgi:hypothetical protein